MNNQDVYNEQVKENLKLNDELREANLEILDLRNFKEILESELKEAKNHIDKLHISSDFVES